MDPNLIILSLLPTFGFPFPRKKSQGRPGQPPLTSTDDKINLGLDLHLFNQQGNYKTM